MSDTAGSRQRFSVVYLVRQVLQLACREIDDVSGVHGFAQIADLQVEMAAGGASCVTSQANHVARRNTLIFIHKRPTQVTVDRLQTVVMAKDHIVSIAARIPSYDTYLTGPSRADRVADLYFYIGALMHSVSTPAERPRHIARSRQYKTRHRYMHILAQAVEQVAVRVHALVRPYMPVEAVRRVMSEERAVAEHELRCEFIDHIAVFGADDNLIG